MSRSFIDAQAERRNTRCSVQRKLGSYRSRVNKNLTRLGSCLKIMKVTLIASVP